jgi:hypothetical protein
MTPNYLDSILIKPGPKAEIKNYNLHSPKAEGKKSKDFIPNPREPKETTGNHCGT